MLSIFREVGKDPRNRSGRKIPLDFVSKLFRPNTICSFGYHLLSQVDPGKGSGELSKAFFEINFNCAGVRTFK